MSRSRKSTAAEAKLKKKEYDRKRREKLKNCPETLEKLREKGRLKYLKEKEKGQVKSDTPAVSSRRKRKEVKVGSNVKISKITPSEKNTYGYKVGDHVLITWKNEVYPGRILSLSDDGAPVRCMKKGSKSWKWPTVEDEELYAWPDVLRIIKPPKLLSRGCYFVKEVDEKK
ncbi:hypothetical protein JTB14_021356 [Gonioctena quinquepunctata]|nr:hypothetical protein JTB14_021356 [Gonioctena quinquepunctata]